MYCFPFWFTTIPYTFLLIASSNFLCGDIFYELNEHGKNKIGEKMPLTTFTNFNIEAFATEAVGWARFGSFMNEAQFRRLATA